MNWLPGIDVSHYQGVIDWAKVAESGIKFAFIKATDGTATDPRVKANTEGARAAGVPLGLYHFWRPDKDWKEQADTFTSLCEWPENVDMLPPVLDIETGALTEDNQQDALNWLARLREMRSPELTPIVYVSPSYANFNLTDPAWEGYPLWVAQYTDNPAPRTSNWKDWLFWQWRCNAVVPGVTTKVDLDWFNGTDLSVLRPPSLT
jgi:lysozyme